MSARFRKIHHSTMDTEVGGGGENIDIDKTERITKQVGGFSLQKQPNKLKLLFIMKILNSERLQSKTVVSCNHETLLHHKHRQVIRLLICKTIFIVSNDVLKINSNIRKMFI